MPFQAVVESQISDPGVPRTSCQLVLEGSQEDQLVDQPLEVQYLQVVLP